jgi:hypothetical protein
MSRRSETIGPGLLWFDTGKGAQNERRQRIRRTWWGGNTGLQSDELTCCQLSGFKATHLVSQLEPVRRMQECLHSMGKGNALDLAG